MKMSETIRKYLRIQVVDNDTGEIVYGKYWNYPKNMSLGDMRFFISQNISPALCSCFRRSYDKDVTCQLEFGDMPIQEGNLFG